MTTNSQSLIGIALVVGAALVYFWPRIKSYLGARNENYIPHAEAQILINYFVTKGNINGADMAAKCGMMIYESFKPPLPTTKAVHFKPPTATP